MDNGSLEIVKRDLKNLNLTGKIDCKCLSRVVLLKEVLQFLEKLKSKSSVCDYNEETQKIENMIYSVNKECSC